ncbi:phage tail tape measure protein [Metabacillus halosaccharovorans]|uniref:phage tail tape measure protein n=1 Tax=Metabacillus halosaccharovorans TaxID=930124 RepID=UPI00403E05F1
MAKQPETKVKFSIFNQEFNKGIAEMNRESTTLRKEFKLQEEQLKQNGSAADLLSNRITQLSSEQDITKRKIQATADQLAKAKTYYGENSNEANKLSNKLLDLQISEQKLENAIAQSKAELSKQSQEMQDAAKEANSLSNALNEAGESVKSVGGGVAVAGLGMVGLGVAAGQTAVDFDGAVRLMNGSLGATGEEAQQLEDDLRTVWTDGFGDNPEQAARAMMMVKQNIRGINEGKPLQEVTKDIITLANVTESDVSEVTRGVNQLMHNFGLTAKEAMDLFAKGQAEGLNFSQEMFDNISEYSPLFKQMGFSAEEYFSILANGSQNGAYNLDYINDIMKEFDIRVRDGSKTTADAFGSMSKNTQSMFQKFKDGKITTEELFNAVIPELEKMDDQVLANQIGVGLFGTKFEDMGAQTVYSLNDVNTSLQNTKGAMDELGKSQEESFGTKLKSTLNTLGQALEPIGAILLNMLTSVTPHIERFAMWFQNLSPTIQQIIVVFGGLATVLGPLIMMFGFMIQGLMPIISGFMKLWGWVSKLGPVFNILRTAFLAITGPVGIIIAVIVSLVAVFVTLWNKSEAFRNFFINTWNFIKSAFVAILNGIKIAAVLIWNGLKVYFTTVLGIYKTIFTTAWNVIKTVTTSVFNGIKSFINSVWNGIKVYFTTVFNIYKTIFTTAWNGIKSVTMSVFNGIKSFINNVWNGIRSVISNVINGIKTSVSSVWNGIKSITSSAFNGIRSVASSVWNGIKSSIVNPIQSAKNTVIGIISNIKSAFSGMKITIPKPRLPKVDISKGVKSIAGIDIPYPKFNITWHKTGGVMTKPFTAGNAGFGDVEEGIVPFEGSHAMKIAKLIAAAQNKLASGLADRSESLKQIIHMTVVSTLDGYEVAKNQYQYINGMMGNDSQIKTILNGG